MTSQRTQNSPEMDSLLATLPNYYKRTGDITVNVKTFWLDEHSSSEEHRFTWLYHISITNHSKNIMQLLGRVWTLIDAYGHEEIIKGTGVIGEQPILLPHETFEYSSGTEFKTPSGLMKGHYIMQIFNPKTKKTTGKKISVMIPTFSLDQPTHKNILH